MYLYLKQKVFSIGEKFTFYDQNMAPVFTAKGSFFAIPKKFTVFYGQNPVINIKRKIFSLLPTYTVYDMPSGQELCTLKRRVSLKANFSIFTPGGEYKISGSLFGYEFDVFAPDGVKVLAVHKKYISWGDTYELYIDETRIQPKLAAGLVVAIDNAVHSNKNRR